MPLPVRVVVIGGLPVQQATAGLPLEISILPGALPVTIVISGGVPCLDPLGNVFAPAFPLTAPVAVWVSAPSVAQATFNIDVDEDVVATNRIFGRASLSPAVDGDGFFTSILEEVDFEIQGADLTDFFIETFEFAPFADGLTYVQFWITDASDVQLSPVSNTISETIAATVSRQTSFFSPIYGGIYMNETGIRQAPVGGLYLNEGAG